MAKGQMRGNKEKKKPKQDKNKQKGAAAPSPFAGMHSQSKPERIREEVVSQRGAQRRNTLPWRGRVDAQSASGWGRARLTLDLLQVMVP